MIRTPSPMLSPSPHMSPASSPHLRPIAASTSLEAIKLNPSPSLTPRSYARQPTARPYQSPLMARGGSRGGKEPVGDTKAFAEMVVAIVAERSRRVRTGKVKDNTLAGGDKTGGRKGSSLGGSLAGSWEAERAELLVDIPVWSPGCFQDLSTCHALRDATLSHTHSMLAYLTRTHAISASYRLLARSNVATSPGPQSASSTFSPSSGWGCIRLAPVVSSPISPHRQIPPAVRRASLVGKDGRPSRRTSSASSGGCQPPMPIKVVVQKMYEEAIVDDPEEEELVDIRLRHGYSSAPGSNRGSDDEDEDEEADVLVAREVEKRGSKEGQVQASGTPWRSLTSS